MWIEKILNRFGYFKKEKEIKIGNVGDAKDDVSDVKTEDIVIEKKWTTKYEPIPYKQCGFCGTHYNVNDDGLCGSCWTDLVD